MTSRRVTVLAIAAVVLLAPAPAYAPALTSLPALPMAGILGGVFGGIGHALLGAFSWTIGLASKFLLTTIAALVKMLIPHSWVHQGLQIMQWIVAVPNYAGKVTSPGGGTAYGFAGINALRDVFMWLGIAIAPLTLVYATSRAMIGEGDPVGDPAAADARRQRRDRLLPVLVGAGGRARRPGHQRDPDASPQVTQRPVQADGLRRRRRRARRLAAGRPRADGRDRRWSCSA